MTKTMSLNYDDLNRKFRFDRFKLLPVELGMLYGIVFVVGSIAVLALQAHGFTADYGAEALAKGAFSSIVTAPLTLVITYRLWRKAANATNHEKELIKFALFNAILFLTLDGIDIIRYYFC